MRFQMAHDNTMANAITLILSNMPDNEALHTLVVAMSVQLCLIELQPDKTRIDLTDGILALVRKMVIDMEAMPDGQA
jgi:hypothetical protein